MPNYLCLKCFLWWGLLKKHVYRFLQFALLIKLFIFCECKKIIVGKSFDSEPNYHIYCDFVVRVCNNYWYKLRLICLLASLLKPFDRKMWLPSYPYILFETLLCKNSQLGISWCSFKFIWVHLTISQGLWQQTFLKRYLGLVTLIMSF